jgi:hypothetical protein
MQSTISKISPLTISKNTFNADRAKYTAELLEFTANVVHKFPDVSTLSPLTPIQIKVIKSSLRDNLSALSRAARVVVSIISVTSFVVGCFQWIEANRLAEKANRLSSMAICE